MKSSNFLLLDKWYSNTFSIYSNFVSIISIQADTLAIWAMSSPMPQAILKHLGSAARDSPGTAAAHPELLGSSSLCEPLALTFSKSWFIYKFLLLFLQLVEPWWPTKWLFKFRICSLGIQWSKVRGETCSYFITLVPVMHRHVQSTQQLYQLQWGWHFDTAT